jgi:hypothetical protein
LWTGGRDDLPPDVDPADMLRRAEFQRRIVSLTSQFFADRINLCYKFQMPRIIERWLLFKYIDGDLTPLSKPLRRKEQAQKARLKYSERERKAIGIGVIRIKG